MKKYYIIISFLLGIIIFFIYLQYGQNMEICNSTSETFKNGYCEDITVIANKLYIKDKQKFAKLVIQKCIDNSWDEIRFSYDLNGYPNELSIDVYTNMYKFTYRKKVSFKIVYSQDAEYNFKYNIKDNPEKFTIQIM